MDIELTRAPGRLRRHFLAVISELELKLNFRVPEKRSSYLRRTVRAFNDAAEVEVCWCWLANVSLSPLRLCR